jgi:hypothetical protein
MTSQHKGTSGIQRERALTIAVPVLAFGGIAVAILLADHGLIADAGTFGWGCVAAAVALGYLAYIKPRRDIVALCAPLYAFFIFVIPMDFMPNLLMQFLFAVSITALMVRLNLKFSSSGIPGGSDPMERFLKEYMERIKTQFAGLPESTAHEIASAFLAFKFGLYNNVVRDCTTIIPLIPATDTGLALKKALEIVKAHAASLDNSQVTTDMSVRFTEKEQDYLAVNLPQDLNDDPANLELDNALTLLYAVAIATSPDDEEALGEHRKFVIRLLTSYKKALGLE